MFTLIMFIISVGLISMLLLCTYIFHCNRLKLQTNNIPGPRFLSDVKKIFSCGRKSTAYEKHAEYGPIILNVKGWTPIIEVASAELAECVLRSSKVIQIPPPGFAWFKPCNRRLWLTPGVELNSLGNIITSCSASGLLLVDKLSIVEKNRLIPFGEFTLETIVLLICELAMGVSLCDHEEAGYFLRAIYLSKRRGSWRKRVEARKELRILIDDLNAFIECVIRMRRFQDRKPGTFLDLLLDYKGYSDMPFLCCHLRSFIFQGILSVSWLVTWTLHELGRNPEEQSNTIKEMRKVWANDKILTRGVIREMTSLDNVIKETMRLHPVIPVTKFKVQRDMQLGAYIAPADTIIKLNVDVIHHDATTFSNPKAFHPYRFHSKFADKRSYYSFLPFGLTPQSCSEQQWIELASKILVAHVLREFEVASTTEPYREFDDVEEIQLNFVKRDCSIITHF